MNSAFLSKIGLGSIDYGYLFLIMFIVLVLMTAALAYVIYDNIRFKKAYKKFMKGSTAESLEEKIFQMCEEQDSLRKLGLKHSREIKEIFTKHQSAFQKVGLVKYDAFKEMGGKLSFCLVLLDENDTGILINSIHNTSGCFCYAKKIKNGKCDIILGEEEQLAVDKATRRKMKIAKAPDNVEPDRD
ncbi:MAG: DUF4446 family protein [Lachnospiraceae bacterium]|nr:DUF4446 family protein [Lachnospiraceae bacterium]